ncbi:MAG: general stress protein CsbD [Candidatus Muproteobacteria bacterium RBG_16_65_34]|uniref:General stress protein CsbD n=1 Tax=Candidatus Muproteobacteria bacterium RBG_16_65_34 TaxID=1817760 RepID=A0A1F6TQI2_9PROT|nr:MAG: general stress protein CsbD [Candidatus Muproteobacteria bacterium RBG_16_65_34]
MNRDRFHGICKQFSGKVKEQWGTLTDDPHAVAAGTRDRLAGRIQERRGISKQEADRQIEDFMSRNRNWRDLSRR